MIMMSSMKIEKLLTCVRCDWTWIPRAANPKSCPSCKRYDWEELIPNAETKKAMKDARKGRRMIASKNVKELFENLNI